jgi:hypothetical protein
VYLNSAPPDVLGKLIMCMSTAAYISILLHTKCRSKTKKKKSVDNYLVPRRKKTVRWIDDGGEGGVSRQAKATCYGFLWRKDIVIRAHTDTHRHRHDQIKRCSIFNIAWANLSIYLSCTPRHTKQIKKEGQQSLALVVSPLVQ